MFILSFNVGIARYKFTMLRLFNIPIHFFILQISTKRQAAFYLPPVVSGFYDCSKILDVNASPY